MHQRKDVKSRRNNLSTTRREKSQVRTPNIKKTTHRNGIYKVDSTLSLKKCSKSCIHEIYMKYTDI